MLLIALCKHLTTCDVLSTKTLNVRKYLFNFLFIFHLHWWIISLVSRWKQTISESKNISKSYLIAHTHAHIHTYIRKHIRVGQKHSSIKNEFRFPCCCCLATVVNFAVTIFYKHSFLFQYPLSCLVFNFLSSFTESKIVIIWCSF